MSIRFDRETLDMLRTLADIHDTNVAEEVRAAVARHLQDLRDDQAFRLEAEESARRQQEKIKQLLGT